MAGCKTICRHLAGYIDDTMAATIKNDFPLLIDAYTLRFDDTTVIDYFA